MSRLVSIEKRLMCTKNFVINEDSFTLKKIFNLKLNSLLLFFLFVTKLYLLLFVNDILFHDLKISFGLRSSKKI